MYKDNQKQLIEKWKGTDYTFIICRYYAKGLWHHINHKNVGSITENQGHTL